jgi:hypothetical protein
MSLPQDPFDEYWIQRLSSSPQPKLTAEERAFWFARTPTERWQMLELIRQRVYGYDAATAKMEKVLSIGWLEDLND